MKTVADVMTAIQSDDIDSLKSLLAAQPELAGERDGNGNSPLLICTYYGRSEMIHLILGQGVRPNVFESSAAGLVRNVELLLKENPGIVNQRSHDGWTPLHLAAFFGHQDLVKVFLDAGASMLAISNNNEANLPINAAAAGRRNAVVRLLVERGCPPDARGSDAGFTALHLAANNDNPELIEYLLEAGADRTLKTGSGQTAYELAVKQGHTMAAELLADSPRSASTL